MNAPNSPKRYDNWRYPTKEAIKAISSEVAEGLFISSSKGSIVRNGLVALRGLSEKDRLAVWKTAFPGIASEMEIAWEHLVPLVIARRDGGSSGYGARFTFTLTPDEADQHFITWLRKLLIVAGPYPDLGLLQLMEHLGSLAREKYDSITGHMLDSDAPAYLASAVLSQRPDDEIALQIATLLEDQMLGRRSGGSDRAIFTAIFCAERPDLWKRFNQHLGEAGKEPAFLERISGGRMGTQPGAVLSYLQTIRDHDLLRFESIAESILYQFGIEWQWKSHRRDDIQPWFDRWLENIESASKSAGALPEEPGGCLLALWAEALFDGDSALRRIENPTKLSGDTRIAAAHFLSLCPADKRQEVAYRYATDSDLRVANIAANLLSSYGGRLPKPEEQPAIFERLREFLEALPAKPKLEKSPAPFATSKLDLSEIGCAAASTFPDGCEKEIERLLPHLDSDARQVVIGRLNRYRLTEFDQELEETCHGDDPEEWEKWLADHDGTQLLAQRQLLLKLLNDRSMEVAQAAYKAVKGFRLGPDEPELLRPVLKSKSAKKRLLVTQLLASQPETLLRQIIPDLLGSKAAGERLAGLEVLRQISDKEETAALASELLSSSGYTPPTKEETRAFEVLQKSVAPAADEDPPGLHNAFGLVDPRSLAKPMKPKERDVIIHSPVTIRLIQALDDWFQKNAAVMIPSPYPTVSDEPVPLGDGKLPYPSRNSSDDRDEQIKRFPLAEELAEWWMNRPADLRDPDGLEALRLDFAINKLLDSTAPQQHTMRKVLFGCENAPSLKATSVVIRILFSWIKFMIPGIVRPEGSVEYLIDSSETVLVRMPDGQKNWANVWGERAGRLIHDKTEVSETALKRIWGLIRNREHDSPTFFHPVLWHVIPLYLQGIATEDELIWFLVGQRPFGDYDKERAFGELGMATSPPGSYGRNIDSPECLRLLDRVVDRIIDLELTRGEEPEVWSYAALRIQTVRSARNLHRLLTALDTTPLRRPASSWRNGPNVMRTAVLISLIQAAKPAADDTPESFKKLMVEAAIPINRLLEISLMGPAWTPFIAHATEIPRLRDAVGWIYAHTRSSDYQWQSNAEELWTGELGFDTPLTADELLEGAVDAEWFGRAYEAVGPKVWETLYGAAKFASTNNGHARAQLFADALLGKVDAAELEKRINKKGDLNAARAIGLPPLPQPKKPRQAELLHRYGVLQKLRLVARKSKAQRRASEMAAVEIGVRNLARRAGFDDTVRFEWAMECEAVADLSKESLQATIDDLDCTVAIQPDGSLAMQASRAGKQLARVPAAAKKHDEFKRLKLRMDELKEQASRLRPALEDLMVRAVALPVAEWKKILAHPLAGPLASRLLLADSSGPLGFPSEKGLIAPDGTTQKWPKESSELHLVHPTELLPAASWHAWQRSVFDQRMVQPFKQIFREVYLPVGEETEGPYAKATRFKGNQVQTHQVMPILSKRGWVIHPEEGLYRVFRSDGICAWLSFEEAYYGFSDHSELTVQELNFATFGKNGKSLAPGEVPDRVFSESLRDVDLIVSVAHASGANPEPGSSTVEIRADLIRETCHLLELENVTLDDRHARVEGELGNYRIHLGSGVVHREPGGMIALKSDAQNDRGRIFLPFADDDPRGIEVLSRVLLFAKDGAIRDPQLAAWLRDQAS